MSAGDMWWASATAIAANSQQYATAAAIAPFPVWISPTQASGYPPLTQENLDALNVAEELSKKSKPKPKEPDGPWEYDDTGILVEPVICGKILK